MGRSRVCIATSYPPLSDIAELPHLNSPSGNYKEAKLYICTNSIYFQIFREGHNIGAINEIIQEMLPARSLPGGYLPQMAQSFAWKNRLSPSLLLYTNL